MNPLTDYFAARLFNGLRFSLVRAAYRLVWLAALTRDQDAESVYVVMWKAGLDLPQIDSLDRRAAVKAQA